MGLISMIISMKDHSGGASKTDHRPPSPLPALAVDSPSSPDAIAIARERWPFKSDNHRTFREHFRAGGNGGIRDRADLSFGGR
jgi:hypothetical protein